MQYLLDTHILLWALTDDEKLTQTAKKIITNIDEDCFISIVTLWEITIKKNIGKLNIAFSLKELEVE